MVCMVITDMFFNYLQVIGKQYWKFQIRLKIESVIYGIEKD